MCKTHMKEKIQFYWRTHKSWKVFKTAHSQQFNINSLFSNAIPIEYIQLLFFLMKTRQVGPKISFGRKHVLKIAKIKCLKNRKDVILALLVTKANSRKTWNKQRCCFGVGTANGAVQERIFLVKRTDGLCQFTVW